MTIMTGSVHMACVLMLNDQCYFGTDSEQG